MHWRKLRFFNISLALYATGIFRIGVTTKHIYYKMAISIPWRNCPYRDRNANLHHCNAETFWGLLRWGLCTFHSHLTHWGRVTQICVNKILIIGSDNGLSPDRRQAIIWTNAWILLIGPLGTNFSEIPIKIHTFSFKKIHLKMASAKWRPFCLSLHVLK